MARAKRPPPVKLIAGILSRYTDAIEEVQRLLEFHLGPIDHTSPLIPFDMTEYYERDMGTSIKRKFLSFDELIEPERIVRLKLWTNEVEGCFARSGRWKVKRPINIDPGYITLGKLILATTKDYSHRVYLGEGIYAESTLRYYKGDFRAWEWTYPDYRTEEYLKFFRRVREIYFEQLRHAGAY